MLSAPVLNGATLRRPNGYTATPEPVRQDAILAGGGLRRYVRGNRWVFDLRWENLPAGDAATIEAAAGRGALLYVDPHGRSWWVFVDEGPEPVPVAGTDPERYDVTLTLTSRDVTR